VSSPDQTATLVAFGDLLKRRLGSSLIVVTAGGAAALITGSSVIAAVVAIVAGLLVVGLIRSPGSKGEPTIPSDDRRAGEPFAWTITGSPVVTLDDAVGRLEAIGLTIDRQGEGQAQLSGGSQLRTRLRGGYFVDPGLLPIAVALEAPVQLGQPVEVRVHDAMGPVGVRDRALETRYALRVAQIRDALQ
jgi:hypothetical protein